MTLPPDGAMPRLKLLIPKWAVDPSVEVNGVVQPAVAPGSMLVLSRTWRAGDTVALRLPCAVVLAKLDDDRPVYRTTYSFVYGDTLLVGINDGGDNRIQIPPGMGPQAWVAKSVARAPGRLRFLAQGLGRLVELMPLNEVVDETYTVYYNLTTVDGAS